MNARQARLLATISEFDIEIRYIKGKENRVANTPSRTSESHNNYEFLQDRLTRLDLTGRTTRW